MPRPKSSKRRNKRIAKKRAIRTHTDGVVKDSMSAARRGWGLGIGK